MDAESWDGVQLFHGDCLEMLKQVPDASVDLVLTDPPYALTQNSWDNPFGLDAWWAQIRRVSKPNAAIAVFGQEPFTSKLICSNLKEFKYRWTWLKSKYGNFLNVKKQPLRCTEDISVFYRHQCLYQPHMRNGKMKRKGANACYGTNYGKFLMNDVKNDIYYPTDLLYDMGKSRAETGCGSHPTEKPVKLMEYFIETYTRPGETVLDCFMGSGTTGVACVNTGRAFIGVELTDEWYQHAVQRIRECVPPLTAGLLQAEVR